MNNFSAAVTILKNYFGIGILLLPYSFAQTGYVLGGLMLIIYGTIQVYSISLLLEVADKMKEEDISYSEITHIVLGPSGSFI